MTDVPPNQENPPRGGDRRGGDRRRDDRRTPLPPWRRPWAFVAYGVAGALLLLLLLNLGDDEEEAAAPVQLTTASPVPGVDTTTAAASAAAPVEASGAAGYERLLAEGERAMGQRVRTELFCEPIKPVQLRAEGTISASVAALADANGRVPGAECRWGEGTSVPDFLLLVPSALAEQFAAAPEVSQGFIQRRRVRAELEWIGRSEALALRNAGVLREIL